MNNNNHGSALSAIRISSSAEVTDFTLPYDPICHMSSHGAVKFVGQRI